MQVECGVVAGIRPRLPSRVGTLVLPYTAALQTQRHNPRLSTWHKVNCIGAGSGHIFTWKSWVFEVRYIGFQILTVKVGVSAIDFQTRVGGRAAQVLVRKQIRAPKKGWVQPVNAFQPHVLKRSIISDYTRQSGTPHVFHRYRVWTHQDVLEYGLLSLAAQVLDLSLTSWSKPQEPQMEEMCFPQFLLQTSGLFPSSASVHPSGFVLSVHAACSPLLQR